MPATHAGDQNGLEIRPLRRSSRLLGKFQLSINKNLGWNANRQSSVLPPSLNVSFRLRVVCQLRKVALALVVSIKTEQKIIGRITCDDTGMKKA